MACDTKGLWEIQGVHPHDGSSQRSSAGQVNNQRSSADRVNPPRVSAGHVNSHRNSSDSSNSQNNGANNVNPIVGAVLGGNAEMSSGEDGSNEGANATTVVPANPLKRGRKKRARTKLRLAPSTGKVQLEPKGSMQFTYVNYNPKDYKYGSQAGTILRRCYPGIVKICDDKSTVLANVLHYHGMIILGKT